MGREIKFRAWDLEAKLMMVGGIHDGILIDLRGNVMHVDYDEGKFVQENVVLMQFTGLLDKNGKEIFEGDLIKHPEFKLDDILTVTWDDYGCWSMSGWDANRTDFTKGEVIGNIFENSYLLETK